MSQDTTRKTTPADGKTTCSTRKITHRLEYHSAGRQHAVSIIKYHPPWSKLKIQHQLAALSWWSRGALTDDETKPPPRDSKWFV